MFYFQFDKHGKRTMGQWNSKYLMCINMKKTRDINELSSLEPFTTSACGPRKALNQSVTILCTYHLEAEDKSHVQNRPGLC